MKVLFDLNHAAHVHFVRNAYQQLINEGHECLVSASDKPLVYQLLKEYNIPYKPMGKIGKSLFAKFLRLILHDIKMLIFCIRNRPDIILGIVSIRGSHAGWVLRIKSIVFTDTEHATKQIALFKPFANEIHTPDWFGKELGKKQVKYAGFHELAYLHPNNFTPRPEVLSMLGVKESEQYSIIRFIAWDATHDKNQYGINLEHKKRIIEYLTNFGKVFITSEYELEQEFKQYEFDIPKSYLHDALNYSTILVSEGATTACESALLGVPTVIINTMQWGYIKLLEDKYQLLHHIEAQDEILPLLHELMENKTLKQDWIARRDKFIESQQDTTQYIKALIKQ